MATAQQIHNREEFQALLLNEERWPPGFEWDFRYPHTCALGLAQKSGVAGGMSEYLGLADGDFTKVFSSHIFADHGVLEPFYNKKSQDVTPADVAKAIGALA